MKRLISVLVFSLLFISGVYAVEYYGSDSVSYPIKVETMEIGVLENFLRGLGIMGVMRPNPVKPGEMAKVTFYLTLTCENACYGRYLNYEWEEGKGDIWIGLDKEDCASTQMVTVSFYVPSNTDKGTYNMKGWLEGTNMGCIASNVDRVPFIVGEKKPSCGNMCDEWQGCQPTGVQTRVCFQENCDSFTETRDCYYYSPPSHTSCLGEEQNYCEERYGEGYYCDTDVWKCKNNNLLDPNQWDPDYNLDDKINEEKEKFSDGFNKLLEDIEEALKIGGTGLIIAIIILAIFFVVAK